MDILFTNLTTKEQLTLSHDSFTYVLESIDWGSVQGTNNYIKYINLMGAEIQSTFLEPRTINIVGWLIASNERDMRAKKSVINKFFNPLQEIELVYEQYVLIIKPDTSVKYNNTDERYNNEILCRFLIQATAKMPLFRLKTNQVYYESSIIATPMFPLIIPSAKGKAFGYIPAISINNVPNEGDVETGFVVRFEAVEGQVINPKLTNNLSEKYIETILSLELGDVLEISTVTGNKYAKLIREEQETDVLRLITRSSSMDMTLNVGINDLTVDASANSVNLKTSIAFSPLWMEVQ